MERCPLSSKLMLACLSLLTLRAAEAAGQMHAVPVDLSAGVFQEYLPFDVDFLIAAPSDPLVQHLKVEFVDKQCLECQANQCSRKCKRLGYCNLPADGCKRSALTEWRRSSSVKADAPIQIQIPPLRAKTRYAFTFATERKPTDVDVASFLTRARDLTDRFFQKKGEIPDLRDAEILALRDALNDLITVNPNEQVVERLFRGRTDAEILQIFREELAGIIDAQDAKFNAVLNFNQLIPSADTHLSALYAPASDLVQLGFALRAGASQDESIKALLADFQVTLNSLLNPPVPPRLMVRGESDFGAAPLASLWTSSAVEARAANIQTTLRTLSSFERLVILVSKTPSLLQVSGMTVTRLNDLVNLIRVTRFEVEAILFEVQELTGALARRSAGIAQYVDGLELRIRDEVTIAGSTDAEFETQHGWYVAADLGVGAAPRIDQVLPYAGVNFYFRPVNKNADLRDPRLQGKKWPRRFSALLGATMQDIQKSGQREGLFANRGVILGGGLRLNRSIRVSGGSLLFRELDPNPLIDKKGLNGTYFFSVSFDWDVRETFAGFGKLIGLLE